MKNHFAILLLSLVLGAWGHAANAAVISSSSACAGGLPCNQDSGTGLTSSANAVINSTNYAKAKTGPGVIGVEARSDSGTSSSAYASWSDVWSPTAYASPGYAPSIGFKYHLDGVIDPRFLDPNSADDVYMDISFSYDFWIQGSPVNFNFNACYDSGPCGLQASLNGTDLTQNIVYGVNQAGDITFSLDYYTPPTPLLWALLGCLSPPNNPNACWWGDSMSASTTVDPFNTGVVGDFHNNFINTFTVDLIAGDAQSMLVSEGGRRTTLLVANVPEPASLLLIGTGLFAISRTKRKKHH